MVHDEEARRVDTNVALNNAGVTLLEKGYAGRALQVWHNILQPEPNGSHNTTTLLVQQTNEWTQQPSSNVFVMDVNVLNDNDTKSLTDAVLYGPSSSMVFALRLCGGGVTTTTGSQHYQKAVCLYNWAMAYRCHYAETNQLASLAGAQQALRACHQVLLQQQQQQQQGRGAGTTRSHSTATASSFTPTYLWALAECARERVVKEQQRHVVLAATSADCKPSVRWQPPAPQAV